MIYRLQFELSLCYKRNETAAIGLPYDVRVFQMSVIFW